MEEKVQMEKTIKISDIVDIARRNLIWILLIVLTCTVLGYAYFSLFQKTEYTVTGSLCVQAKDYIITDNEGNEVTTNTAEHTKYQYSALIAPEYENVLKSADIVNALKEQGISINISDVNFNFKESSAFFDVSYTLKVHGGNATIIKQQAASRLNGYLEKSIEVINDSDSVYPNYLKDKLVYFSMASADNVSVNTGFTKTIALSILIGIVLSVILIVVVYFADNTVKDKDDLENISGISNLAIIDLYVNQVNAEKKTEAKGAK